MIKLNKVYELKRPIEGLKYVVYKLESNKVCPTYYASRRLAETDKN
jgi:hypothetical protein